MSAEQKIPVKEMAEIGHAHGVPSFVDAAAERLEFLLGEARHALQLEQEGEELKGRYRSQFGEQEVRGRIRGDDVEMRVGIHYQACGTRYGFSGKWAGDAMKGEVNLGEYWSGKWEAKKVSS